MQKGIALITYIYETGVEPWHEFFDFCQVDVSDGKRSLSRFLLVFDHFFVFQKCDGNLFLSYVDDYFARHALYYLLVFSAIRD